MYFRLFLPLVCALGVIGQVAPPSAAPSPQNSTDAKPASLSGKTTTHDGQPIKKTVLTLRPVGPFPRGQSAPAPYVVNSDAEGKFVFEAIDPGRYLLSANRPGYQNMTYGARRAGSGGTVLSFTSGQTMSAIDIVLSPQIVISGKVLDSDGDPIGRAQIQAMRFLYSNGKRQLVPTGSTSSDENGDYKIQNLPPGKYYLCATPQPEGFFGVRTRSAAAPPPEGQPLKPEEKLVATYYPGVTDPTAATAIELATGRDRPGTDITLRKSFVFHVRGKVNGQIPGERLQQRILLAPRSSVFLGFNNASSPIDQNGAFDVFPVPSGSYYLTLTSSQGMLKVFASLPVDVATHSLDNLTITPESPADLSGLIKREKENTGKAASNPAAQTKAGPSHMRISLQLVDGLSINVPNTLTKDDDTFLLPAVLPGHYKVSVFSLPEGAYLKSVSFENQDVLKNGLVFSSGGGSTPLEITLGSNAATLTGTVQDAEGKPVTSAAVTLVPDPPAPDRGDLYKQSSADQNGQFSISSIAPGKYRVYAWTDLEPGSQFDPDFLKNYESKGVKLDVAESASPQVKLTPVQQ